MNRRLFLIVMIGLTAILAFNDSLLADDDMNEREQMYAIDEIVVTASRYEENIGAVPANITIITEMDIEKTAAYNIPDLLRTQAGLYVNDITGNRRSYTVDIRGFGESAGRNTLVLVDGRRINQADLSDTDWTLIPLDRIEKIEIIRGGRGSVLYGDNAAGGVINILTKEGNLFNGGAEIQVGSYDSYKGRAYLSDSLEKISYFISGSYLKSDGYRDNSDTEAKEIGMNIGFYPNDILRFNLSAGYNEDHTGLPGDIKKSEFARGVSRTETLDPDNFSETEDYYFKGKLEFFLTNKSHFLIDGSTRKRSTSSYITWDSGNSRYDTEIDTIIVSPQFIIKEDVWRLKNNFTIGFDLTDTEEDIFNRFEYNGYPSVSTPKLQKKNTGYYIHEEIRPIGNLALSGGYRHDRAKFSFAPSVIEEAVLDADLFTAGISFNYSPNSYVYGSFSRSFRYPLLDELYNFTDGTIYAELKPEASDNYEIGLRHQFNENIETDINFFRIDTENEIFFNPVTFKNDNLEYSNRRQGVEFLFAYRLKNVKLTAGYVYTKAEILDGTNKNNDLPNVPNHRATLTGQYDFGNGFSIAANGLYVGERPFISDFENAFNNQDDYLVFNAKIRYSKDLFNIFLDLNNITNEEYAEYGAIGGYPLEEGYYPSPKFNMLLGVAIVF